MAGAVRGARLHDAGAGLAGRPRNGRGRPSPTPRCFAGKSIGDSHRPPRRGRRCAHRKPIVIGHSFGGFLTQKLAGMGLAAGAVAIDPAPFRGVLPLPVSSLKSSFPVLEQPGQWNRAVMLTFEQWTGTASRTRSPRTRAASCTTRTPCRVRATAVPGRDRQHQPADRGQRRHEEPGPRPAAHHLRGAGPHRAVEDRQRLVQALQGLPAPTEITEIPGRGHSLVIDHGWRDVADTALAFLERHHLTA